MSNKTANKQSLVKDYYRLSDAAKYLTSIHGEIFNAQDLISYAKRGKLKVGFSFDGEIGIFEDHYGEGDFEYIGKSFYFSGYLTLNPSEIALDNSTTAVCLENPVAFDTSDSIPSLKRDYHHYCGCTVPDGKGNQYLSPIPVKQDDFVISKDDLESFSDSLTPSKSNVQISSDLATTERITLYKIILGMAMEKYKYDPNSSRNLATGKKAGSISADLQKYELDVSGETIKTHLDKAKELIS